MQNKKNTLLKNSNIIIKESAIPSPMFPYQEDAIKNLEELDKVYDRYRTLVVIPTGGGKTRIAVQYLYRNVLNRKGTKVLWICERLSLLTQAHQSFVNLALRKNFETNNKAFEASEITAHVFSSQDTSFRDVNKSKDVQMVFVTKQTLCKMLSFSGNSKKPKEIDESFEDWLENTDELTVIIDEAHHAVGDDYRNIIHAVLYKSLGKVHIIGLTATPKNTRGSKIEEVFLHGIDIKTKKPTDTTCYASRVSINQLIAEEYLAKPFLANKKVISSNGLVKTIVDTYKSGVSALALETLPTQDKDKKNSKELHRDNSFGQTVIFVKSREIAISLWSEFRKKEIDCGISISIDEDNNLEKHKECFQEYITENLKSDQIVSLYEKRYARNILPVIISVDKFKEGVDVPKTQTVFIARDSSAEISVTQMVGRALRGVLQGGTSEAYLVGFGDNQLDNILWEVPDNKTPKDFLKEHSILFKTQTNIGNNVTQALEVIDLASLKNISADEETIAALIENLCSYVSVQSSPDDNGSLIIPNEVIGIDIPIGYVQLGQKYLIVWDKTQSMLSDIQNALKLLKTDDLRNLWEKQGISATLLRIYANNDKYAPLHNIIRENTYESIYWNYVYTMLFYIFEVHSGNKDEAINKMESIQVKKFVDFKISQLHNIATQIINGTFSGEIDDFLNQQWKQSKQLGVSELYFKAYFKQFYMTTAELKQDIAKSEYFRIRLYRDGRKRENLVKLLQLILKGGVIQKTYSDDFDFYDVFGGTGTMTVSLKDTVKGKRHLNEFDVVVCKALYFIKDSEGRLTKNFKETFVEFNNKWYDYIKDKKIYVNENKMYTHLKSIFENTEYREEYGKDATKGKSAEKIIRNWAKNIKYDDKYADKQKKITSNKESLYKAVSNEEPKIMSFERGYLEKRYKELVILEEALKRPEVKNVVEMYLALYVSFEQYIKQINKEMSDVYREKINEKNLKCFSDDDRLLVFAFLYVHSFSSYIVSKPSEAGVDPKGISKFKKLLSEDKTWLDEFSDRLQGVEITSKDFSDVLEEASKQQDNNKVYYLDPPYFLTNQYACGFSDEKHLEMLKWLRETTCNWVFSCKSKETNESLYNRKKGSNKKYDDKSTRYIHTEKNKLFEEYFRLFLYDEREVTEETYTEVYADMKRKVQKKDLYVYYIEPLVDNYYEIMISNIPPNKEESQVFESYNFKCESFCKFFNEHYNYNI